MIRHDPSSDPLRDVYGRADVALPTAAEAATADHAARADHGVPQRVLMENAGRAAALVLHRLYPDGRVVGLAGSGNNGGDLLVMLRVLKAWGRDVRVITAGTRSPDPALAHGADIDVVSAADAGAALLATGAVLVDGLLGTGTTGSPRGGVAEWIRRLNATASPVVSLDLPSGVDATSGRVPGEAVQADLTITFGWPKLGLLLHPARRHCGRIVAVEIGFPDACSAAFGARAITSGWVSGRLRARPADAHKGSAGRLLVLAGSTGMAGAAALAAEAALRAGAGLVRIASTAENRQILQVLVPEATFLDRDALTHDDAGTMHALVTGPGLGQGSGARAALERALALMPALPTLLDADALNVLAGEADVLRDIGAGRPLVLTPHARELSRITGVPLEEIVADTPAAARAAARSFGCAVLLKGQPSVVATADGALFVNTSGSSDVATAGMGDQLAGTIGALLVGGVEPADAAALGLFLSGRAADLNALGRSLTPRDVSACLARAMATPGPAASSVGLPFITFDQPARW
jgi:ADP-dependent NAD(P)H-hydrate dehydratase / NAD(P)H-hydrate epimerase